MSARTWELVIDTLGRPPTANSRRRQHWRTQARSVEAWKHAALWMARQQRMPRLMAIEVECWGRYPNGRSLPDTDAVAPALKAVLDGLVIAQIIPNDTPAHVHGVTYRPPVVAHGMPALVVRITEIETALRGAS